MTAEQLPESDRPEHRCVPGRKTVDRRCTVHPSHYWCDGCQGFYGVPHDHHSCHSLQERDDKRPIGHTSPWPGQCACRFCMTVHRKGWVEARLLVQIDGSGAAS